MKARLMILGICAIVIASCGGGEADPTATPTFSADQIQTVAVETFSAALTQTALVSPSETPVPTLTASATFAPPATLSGGTTPQGLPTSAATTSCYRLAYVSDVTIPDNTAMTAGQTFTKTWKVANTGSCAWDAGFKFSLVSGDAMGGATYTLASVVPANSTFDISVDMTAPAKSGTIRGDWRMSTAGGQVFGDIVYVQIVVGATTGTPATATNTSAAATSTAAPTTTPTVNLTPP